MSLAKPPSSPPAPFSPQLSETGLHCALMFALVTERLSVFYEHGQWIKDAQGITLANDWLARTRRRLPHDELKQISAASDDMAREIASTLSREAGLYTAHDMTEALDPNYQSELAHSMMDECTRRLAALNIADEVRPKAAERLK